LHDVEWWQDAIRTELDRAHDHYDDVYETALRGIAEVMLTCKWDNTSEWMEYLAEELQAIFDAVGESATVIYDSRSGVIKQEL
jgi:hypothetical protein